MSQFSHIQHDRLRSIFDGSDIFPRVDFRNAHFRKIRFINTANNPKIITDPHRRDRFCILTQDRLYLVFSVFAGCAPEVSTVRMTELDSSSREISAFAFTKGQRLLAVTATHPEGRLATFIEGVPGIVSHCPALSARVLLSSDGEYLLSYHPNNYQLPIANVWPIKPTESYPRPRHPHVLNLDGKPVAEAFSHNSAFVAIATDTNALFISDGQKTIVNHFPAQVTALQFSSSNRQLVAGFADGVVRIFNIITADEGNDVANANRVLSEIRAEDAFFNLGSSIVAVACSSCGKESWCSTQAGGLFQLIKGSDPQNSSYMLEKNEVCALSLTKRDDYLIVGYASGGITLYQR